jgi:putative zinc finger protein
MNCEQVQSLLVAYVDGEVTPSERALIQVHLSTCTVCQQELTLLSTARSRVRTMLQRRAVHAVPSQDAWNRLEAKLTKADQPSSSKSETWFSRKAPGANRRSNPKQVLGGVLMQKRLILSVLAGALVLTVLAVLVARNAIPVSARQILDRAYQVQTQAAASQGIEHIRTEIYGNLEAQPEEQGLYTTTDKYLDLQSDKFRRIIIDNQTGGLIDIVAYDGSNAYSSESTKGAPPSAAPLTIYRTPQNPPSAEIGTLGNGNSGLGTKALFDKMRSDPQVQLAGKETWEDGRTVYVLRSEQPVRVLMANEAQSPNGIVDMYFDVDTYELVGNRVTIQKDGKELLIGSQRILVDETLAEGSSVAWDLSDLQGVNIVDDPNGQHALPEVISVEALATRIPSAYLLRTVPDGFSLEVSVLPKQFTNRSGNGPFYYEAGYINQAGDYFIIRAFDDKPLEDTSWADEIYTTASGLVLYFVNQPSIDPKFTGGLMQAPNGHTYAIDSTLSRERIKELLDDLVLVK